MDRQPQVKNFAPPSPFATFGLLGVFTAIRNYREAYHKAVSLQPADRQGLNDAQAALLSAVLMMPDLLRVEEGQQVQTMEPQPGKYFAISFETSYHLLCPHTPRPEHDLPVWWAYEAEKIAREVWGKLEKVLVSQTRQFAKRAAWEGQQGAGLLPGATKLD